MEPTKPRVIVVAAAPMTLCCFMRPHLAAMCGWLDVAAICDGKPEVMRQLLPAAVHFRPIAIKRRIALLDDVAALFALIRIFARMRPTIVHSITPKAGLLAMTAAFICRVPIRVHVFTGQVWVTKRGFLRKLLRCADQAISLAATHVLADSASQRAFLVEQGVCSPRHVRVLANGSISGVDLTRFRPSSDARKEYRDRLAIPLSALVILFVGRLAHDKGVLDLARAFRSLGGEINSLHLVFVGPDEEKLGAEIRQQAGNVAERCHIVGMSDRPEDFMAAADIFALPSYREGFGAVVVEAAACGIPTVASRIYGVTDAVEDGRTGLLHEAGSVEDLKYLLRQLLLDSKTRTAMGANARQRAEQFFSVERVVQAQMDFYRELLVDINRSRD